MYSPFDQASLMEVYLVYKIIAKLKKKILAVHIFSIRTYRMLAVTVISRKLLRSHCMTNMLQDTKSLPPPPDRPYTVLLPIWGKVDERSR